MQLPTRTWEASHEEILGRHDAHHLRALRRSRIGAQTLKAGYVSKDLNYLLFLTCRESARRTLFELVNQSRESFGQQLLERSMGSRH
jgi:hypothetical protein